MSGIRKLVAFDGVSLEDVPAEQLLRVKLAPDAAAKLLFDPDSSYPLGSIGYFIKGIAVGTPNQVHLRYSDDGGVTFTAGGGTVTGAWLGTAVTASTTAPVVVGAYTWTQIRGGQGPQGSQGTPGVAGTNGQTSYFHVAYASAADGSAGFNQSGGRYIGTYVDFTATDSNNPALYAWRLFEGDDGIPGVNGANGQTSYLHLKYSNDGGATFTASNGETAGSWRGEYVDLVLADSNLVSAYTWVKVEGPQGPQGPSGPQGSQGTPGAAGANGQTTYFHVAYASAADGSAGFNQSGGRYIGTYVDFTATDSNNPAVYTWRLFEGGDGIPGVNGADGQTSYLHLKYSNDGGATFTATNGETSGSWLGQYVDFTLADSNSVGAYTWSKIAGAAAVSSGVDTYVVFPCDNAGVVPASAFPLVVTAYATLGGITDTNNWTWSLDTFGATLTASISGAAVTITGLSSAVSQWSMRITGTKPGFSDVSILVPILKAASNQNAAYPNSFSIDNYGETLTPTDARSEARFNVDGSISTKLNSAAYITSASRWYVTTGGTPGNTHSMRFRLLGGSSTGGTAGGDPDNTWHALSSARYKSLSLTTNGTDTANRSYAVDFALTSNTSVVLYSATLLNDCLVDQ